MLTQVQIRNGQGALLLLPLENDVNFVVTEIEGLDPVKATIVSSSVAGRDGEQYHSSKREARNIKISLEFLPDYVDYFDAESLRERLYEYVMPKSPVRLIFSRTNKSDVQIDGWVESMDAPLFTPEPATVISIICTNPDFVDSDLVILEGMTTSDGTNSTINYAGSIETGIRFRIFPDRDLSDFTIHHTPPTGVNQQLEFVGDLIAGDQLNINTITGEKGSYLTRGGLNSSTLYGVQPESKWIELLPGPNLFRVSADGAPIPYVVEYVKRFGGL